MTDWRVKGNVLIACSCDWGCPCNFNARPTRGFCQGGWTWIIDEGRVGDVDVGGIALSIFCAWPKAIHEGDGKATAVIDDRAGEAQFEALTPLVRGEIGGPWGIFINTYELSGPQPARYSVNLAEHATTLKIGDMVDLEIMPITNPVTGAEVHPEMILPEGLVLKRAHLAATKTFRVDDGISFDHSGKYSAFGPFEYEGPA
jgi:hypothetical protein